jgi:microcystin-dependent protein
MWSGTIGNIPSGWLLCNGTNGTPNLTDKFIVGAGNNYAASSTGGSADAIVVSHTHTATSTVTDPGHLHTWNFFTNEWNTGTAGDRALATNRGTIDRNTATAVTGITVGTTISTEGSSGSGANLPPYYALAFIMRVA